MIYVNDSVRIIEQGDFYGQIGRVLRIDATSRDGHVWYQVRITLRGLPGNGWFEQKDIEELPKGESEEAL